ncbi:MAG: tetratricopeptide repeat protein [Candidatus Obscuribacterales bacterium]|nr:tetratricopeptide repeat protein [Candidatus Obscuribacterales bacterium]
MKKITPLASISLLSLLCSWSSLGYEAQAANSKTTVYQDGLKTKARVLINRGQWPDAIDELKRNSDTRSQAWLAFAYLYQGKHSELKELAETVKSASANENDPNAAKIIEAFALISGGKLDQAQTLLTTADKNPDKDLLLNFAKACVALKKGDPKTAATYCETCVNIEPTFAWGWRTLGFIQEKSLKNPASGERAYEKAIFAEPNSREVRELLVDLKLSHNDFDGALAVAQAAIKLAPHNADNFYRLGQIYIQQWRLEEALVQLQKAISLNGNDPRYFRSRARIFRYQGKLAEAISEQKKACELGKDRAFEFIELANLQELSGDAPSAISSLQEALKANATNSVAQNKLLALLEREKRYDDLVAEYKRQLAATPQSAPLKLGLALALKKSGKVDEALSQLKEAANLDQKDPRPHREAALIEMDRNNYSAAAKAYTRALNINPSSVGDLLALGICYARNRDYMQAETAFVTGLALQQLGQVSGASGQINPFDIMRSLASVLLAEGRYREATVNMEAVAGASKDPEQKKRDEFAMMQCRALRDRTGDSARELVKAYNALPEADQKTSLLSAVDPLLQLGKIDLALDVAKKFGADNPLAQLKLLRAEKKVQAAQELANKIAEDKANAIELRAAARREEALMIAEQGDTNHALETVQKAIEIDPKFFLAYVDKGNLLLQAHRPDEAITAAQKALDINPYCQPAYMLLGEVYLSTNKVKDAENNYLKAVELYPTSAAAHKGLRRIYEKTAKPEQLKQEDEILKNIDKNS